MKKLNLPPARSLACAMLACATLAFTGHPAATRASAAGIEPDAAYERMVDGRIAVNYYNHHLQEIIPIIRFSFLRSLTENMEQIDKFIAADNYNRGSPGFSGNWRNAQKVTAMPVRVPSWYPSADQKLFKDGLAQINKDAGELLKLCEEFQEYFRGNGPWKDDKCKKYTAARPRLQSLIDSLRKTTGALDQRALEMALAGEKLFWEQDKALGYFVSTMKADVDNALALEALLKNPELQKEGNSAAAATLPQVEKLLATLKQSREQNAALSTPMLTDDMKRHKDRFYADWVKDVIERTEKNILPGLKAGILKKSDADSMGGNFSNLSRGYDDFIDSYTYKGGVAIKYKRY